MERTHIVRVHHPSGKLYEAWCDFVGRHPDGTFFQSDVVFRHAAAWPGSETVLLLLLDGSHRLQGSLLAIIVGGGGSILGRFTRTTLVYGGPVLAQRRRLQEHMNLDALLKALIPEVKSRSASIRFVNMRDWSDHQPVFNGNGFVWLDADSLLLGTSNRKKVWDALSEECRKRISSSIKNGAVSFDVGSSKQLQDFFALLQRSSSKRASKALPPLTFFNALAEEWMGTKGRWDEGTTIRRYEGAKGRGDDFTTIRGDEGTTLRGDDFTTIRGDEGTTLRGDEGTRGRGYRPDLAGLGATPGDPVGTGLDLSADGRSPENADMMGSGDEGAVGSGFFVLVEYRGRIVGGAVCPVVSGRLVQVWLVTGMDRELGRQGVYPGVLALWAVMERTMKNKIPFVSVLDRAVLFEKGIDALEPLFGGDRINYGRFVRRNCMGGFMW